MAELQLLARGACVVLILLIAGDAPAEPAGRVQPVVNELIDRLGLKAEVTAAVVPTNALLVSVEFSKERPGGFVLSFEDAFLRTLSDDELRAVIAHELGHVWIFTHHPYLQTERLANDVARRVVSREILVQVYAKVWERAGTKGDLARFLGN
jgi:Peptidase family M48